MRRRLSNGVVVPSWRAHADLAEAFRWCEERRAGLGYEFTRFARATLQSIEQNPEQYPLAADDIRKAPLRRFPYVVCYVILNADISVVAVMHSRRHPRRWKERR
jgi:plasmid stabilization system protein ParE